ncbi:LAME_0A04742g1_1 [Lachancea meyersii CBS 8951]|uniref:LAME_0A04742g1_1 n=1 Tax=Lachancea meyersii CBS 8951 TaxID=1266667 RepID=A0A1G4IPN5_9SACH|nr:LAME_0A04742g1_1 [Lachancea meyersii CBS 8951]
MLSLGLNKPSLWMKPLRMASRRLVSTVKTNAAEEQQILIAQRKNRPVSPHLTIYQPQLTWYLSSLHRITGVILGLGFFTATIAFGVSTAFGLGLNSNNLAKWYHEKVPLWMDWTAKGAGAYFFAFHFSNGIRHLIWDTGRALTLKGVYTTGYAVLAFMVVAGTSMLTW